MSIDDDWPNERHLDVRQTEILLPLMQARFDRCKALGFDAIEPDNMDLHENPTGLDIQRDEMLSYARLLADYAHQIGHEIGQKNAPDMVPELVDQFDFFISESCFYYDFCDDLRPYLQQNKDVLAAEYPHKAVNHRQACQY